MRLAQRQKERQQTKHTNQQLGILVSQLASLQRLGTRALQLDLHSSKAVVAILELGVHLFELVLHILELIFGLLSTQLLRVAFLGQLANLGFQIALQQSRKK